MTLELDDCGLIDTTSHTECPNCGFDLGWYGDLINGFTCENCGMSFVIEIEREYWFRVVKGD